MQNLIRNSILTATLLVLCALAIYPPAEKLRLGKDLAGGVSLTYSILAGSVGVREDVVTDPAFLEANPTAEFFSSLVEYTNFRPALEVYPQVSSLTQEIMESVTVGGMSAEDAAANYDRQLTRLVGSRNVKEAD